MMEYTLLIDIIFLFLRICWHIDVDVALTGPVFVPGVAGKWLQAKTVERHVWTEAAGM